MKKKGFTLAEVLIAMTIIGVVAAIIIPQFVTSTHNQAHASRLSTIVSDLQNAIGTMMLKENAGDVFETSFGRAYTNSTINTDDVSNALGRYMKVAKTATSTSDLGYIAFHYSSPLIPAAYAAESPDPCCSDESSGCYEEYTCKNMVDCLGQGGHYIPGENSTTIGACIFCEQEYWDDETGTCNTTNGECKDHADAYSCYDPTCPSYNTQDCIKYRCTSDIANSHYDYSTGECIPRNPSSSGSSENPPSSNPSAMHTIRNELVDVSYFNFVLGVQPASGANIFFKEPETIAISVGENQTRNTRIARVFIDVNGNSVPNKFGRDVFAYVLTEEGQLLPFGSESAALALGLAEGDNNTWKGQDVTLGCTGNRFNGLGCTARLIENNYKVDY